MLPSDQLSKSATPEYMFNRVLNVLPENKNPKSTLSNLSISMNVQGREDKSHLRTQLSGS